MTLTLIPTYTKVAFVDLDGRYTPMVADASARFQLAREAKEDYLLQEEITLGHAPNLKYPPERTIFRNAEDLFWGVAFNPDNIKLDVPCPGAYACLAEIQFLGFALLYVTSRPEPMRLETEAWLRRFGLDFHVGLLMKPLAAKYEKTFKWKATAIHQLAAMLHAREVVVVDDEEPIRDEVLFSEGPYSVAVYSGLDLAETDEAPF